MDITVKLSIETWNVILDCLADAPVRKAMPIINAILAQAKEQLPANAMPQPINGAILKAD